ncbi:MAG: NAD(P)/FAD-dependent oxidoreductase [Clostridium sp.]|nr:NAD(P)/FAD-dependent oxidoreductase [Clostridium sp.]
MSRQIVIVGGGASGLTAAIMGARLGARVTLVEHMDRVGKKILSTGNGRCNLTNLRMEESCYRSDEKGFPMRVIGGFGVEETLGFFRELGIEPKDRNGYVYPNSDQASSVLDVLLWEASHERVDIRTSCKVETIEWIKGENNSFYYKICTTQGIFRADALILATGSRAAPSTGSDGSGYELAKKLGHRVIKPLPGLVQLRCQGTLYRQLAGIRTEARITLHMDGVKGRVLAEDRGELQLTDYGLSGIPVFQISRFAARALEQGKKVVALVDFLPSWQEGESFGLLKRRAALLKDKKVEEMFTGLFNKKLAAVLIRLSGVSPSKKAGELTGKELGRLLSQMKSYEAIVMSVNPFANAQVCCGGVDTREIDPSTMESRLKKNLYLTGELLDVDGICGGYNLQFAWSSGALAGRAAAGEVSR